MIILFAQRPHPYGLFYQAHLASSNSHNELKGLKLCDFIFRSCLLMIHVCIKLKAQYMYHIINLTYLTTVTCFYS